MTIKRVVNGTEMEFELTSMELYAAYLEKEHLSDKDEIFFAFDGMDDDEMMESYGVTMEDVIPLVNEMAYRFRKYMNEDESWSYNREEAIHYILDARKEGK